MDELTDVQPDDSMKMTLPVEITAEDIAAALVHGNSSSSQLLELISSIDSEVQEWAFTLDLARWVLPLLIEYASEGDDSDLINAVQALMGQLDQIER